MKTINELVIMNKDTEILKVWWDNDNIIHSEFLSKPHVAIPRDIYPDKININTFFDFLESRLPPRTRIGIEDILKDYNVPDYLPFQMCIKSHGRKVTDFIWIRFEGETLTYEDIRLR